MKIQRYELVKGNCIVESETGNLIKYTDIAHLIPAENPDYEPCELAEATQVMNARGEVFEAHYDPDHVLSVKFTDYYHRFTEQELYAACLTPARKRKVEPIVFVGEVRKSNQDVYTAVGNALTAMGRGKAYRMTIEEIAE